MQLKTILMDTTYLCPQFGLGIRIGGLNEDLKELLKREIDLLFNPLSIVEIKWIHIAIAREKIGPKEKLRERFRRGLVGLLETERFRATPLTSVEVEVTADLLLDQGVTDYFDRMIFASAKRYAQALVSEDSQLQNLPKRSKELEGFPVINWKQLKKYVEI